MKKNAEKTCIAWMCLLIEPPTSSYHWDQEFPQFAQYSKASFTQRLPDTAQEALPLADHTLLGILRSIGHIIQDAEPLQRQWDLLRRQVSRDWNQSLSLTPFAGLDTNIDTKGR